MSLSIPLPLNHASMSPRQLFEAAKKRGIGRTNTVQKPTPPWTVEGICQALRQQYRTDPKKSVLAYTGTVNGWSKGQIPHKHRRAFLFIFTPEHRLENWQEWRNAFIACWNKPKETVKKTPRKQSRFVGYFEFGPYTHAPFTLNERMDEVIQERWPGLRLRAPQDLSLNVLTHEVLAKCFQGVVSPMDRDENFNFQLLYTAGLTAAIRMTLTIWHEQSDPLTPTDEIDWEAYAHYLVNEHPPLTRDAFTHPAKLDAAHYMSAQIHKTFPNAMFSTDDFTRFFTQAFYQAWGAFNYATPSYWAKLIPDPQDAERISATLALQTHRLAIADLAKIPMFSDVPGQDSEPFSVQDLYVDIPLQGKTDKEEAHAHKQEGWKQVKADDLMKRYITSHWSTQPRVEHFLMIRGAPGSGKSSVLKEQLRRIISDPVYDDMAVVFIPLCQHGPFEEFDQTLILRGVTPAGFSLQRSGIDVLDVFQKSSFNRLLIVFDGLDELGRQEQNIEDLHTFSRVLELTDMALKTKPVKYILSGRDQPFRHLTYPPKNGQQSYRLQGLSKKSLRVIRQVSLKRNQHIYYKYDVRYEWLEKYSRFKFLHPVSRRPDLFDQLGHPFYELTQNPLLLLLLCRLAFINDRRSSQRERVLDLDCLSHLEDNILLNQNDIFQILIQSIRHSPHKRSPFHERSERMGGLPQDQFEAVLSCLAMPAWRHHAKRGVSVQAFLKEATRKKLKTSAKKLITVPEGQSLDTTDPMDLGLRSIFYLRTHPANATQPDEFEFTHKSFANYLIAAQIFRSAIELVLAMRSANHSSPQYDLVQNWIELTRNGEEIDQIHLFIASEAQRYLRGPDALPSFMGALARCVGQYPGNPDQKLRPEHFEAVAAQLCWLPYQGENDNRASLSSANPAFAIQRKSFRIFFNVFGALVKAYGDLEKTQYRPASADFPEFLRAANEPIPAVFLDKNECGQTDFIETSLLFFDLSGMQLSGLNLTNGNFSNSNLTAAQFRLTYLNHSLFKQSNLVLVEFIDCQLSHSRFCKNTDFSFFDCIARHAIFNACTFNGSTFTRSDFSGGLFKNCTFEKCHFELMCLDDCTFIGCTFIECTFLCCTLRETIFEGGVFLKSSWKHSDAEQLIISEATKFKKVAGFKKNNRGLL